MLPGAAITDLHKFRRLQATEIYCLTVVQAELRKVRYRPGHVLSLKALGEGPSLLLLASGSCSLWNPFASFQSVPLKLRGIFPMSVSLSKFPSFYKDTRHWIRICPNPV